MSRKHKPKSLPAQAVPAAAAGAAPEVQAQAALAASRFKDAIEQFKALLKIERRPAWIDALATAYAGRADQLAAKGLIKEAIALWRTRAQACATPLLAGRFLRWLLQGGQAEQAFALLRDRQALGPELRDEVERELAAAALVAPDAWLAILPDDDALVRHRAAAQAALAAALGGDDAALAQALPAIAFRSPYRDLRPLLRAMALLRSDPLQSAALLDRVAAGGPFERLAAALRVAALPADQWFAGLRGLDPAGRAVVFDLAGCPESQRALVTELAQAGDAPAPALLDLIARHRRVLPDGQAREMCLRLLPHSPQRVDTFRSAFGPLPRAEFDRTIALAAEVKQDYDAAEEHWSSLIDQWRTDPARKRHAAMVLRHLAADRHFTGGDDAGDSPALDWLAESLDLDPMDRESELRLLRGLRERGDLKQVRERLDVARERFAGDPAVLLEAVQTALAAGAFKKAIGLAKQVLQIDPLNSQVRSVIGQAHLSHARKQIEARNPKAARRELDDARSWLRGTAELATHGVLRGLAADAPADGDALLRQALADLGGALAGAFQIAIEAAQVRFDAAVVLRRAGADLSATPGAAELVALAHALNARRPDERAARAAIEPLRPMLQRAAADAPGSESELTLVCEALHRHGQPDLTRRFAAQALKRWPGRPAFVYFDVAARYQGEPWRIPPHECKRLDDAFERAQAQGDRRSASRLGDLLAQAGGFDFGPGPESPPGIPNAAQALEAILALGGERDVMALARRELGRAQYDELRREIGGSDKQFARALVQLLGAADALPDAAPAVERAPPKRRAGRVDDLQRGLFDD